MLSRPWPGGVSDVARIATGKKARNESKQDEEVCYYCRDITVGNHVVSHVGCTRFALGPFNIVVSVLLNGKLLARPCSQDSDVVGRVRAVCLCVATVEKIATILASHG